MPPPPSFLTSQTDALTAKAEAIEGRSSILLRAGIERLTELEQKLGGLGVVGSRRVQLELVGPEVALLKQQARFLEAELSKLKFAHRTTSQKLDKAKRRLGDLSEEIQSAEACNDLTMVSATFTGSAAVFNINDLRVGLRQEAVKLGTVIGELNAAFRKVNEVMSRSVEELKKIHEWLKVEERPLAQVRVDFVCVCVLMGKPPLPHHFGRLFFYALLTVLYSAHPTPSNSPSPGHTHTHPLPLYRLSSWRLPAVQLGVGPLTTPTFVVMTPWALQKAAYPLASWVWGMPCTCTPFWMAV